MYTEKIDQIKIFPTRAPSIKLFRDAIFLFLYTLFKFKQPRCASILMHYNCLLQTQYCY